MRGRRVGEGGYDGEESYGRGMIIFLGGGRIIRGEKTVCLAGLFFWCWEFGFGVFENHCRGHRVVGGFGHGGQDSFRFPGS